MKYLIVCYIGIWFSVSFLTFALYFPQPEPPKIFGVWLGLSFGMFTFLSTGMVRKYLN